MVGETGFEPVGRGSLIPYDTGDLKFGEMGWTLIGIQKIDSDCPDLAKILGCWDRVPQVIKDAIVAMLISYMK